MSTAIGYARISKKGDAKSVSIELQKQQIAEYCKRQGFVLSDVVTHDGVSGTKRKRFAVLDEAVKRHGPSHVIVYHLDRLARDAAGLADYLRSLTKRGIQVHEVAGLGRIDTKQAVGRLVTGIRGVTDQYFAEVTGEKTAAALNHLREQGKQYTNIPPLGWTYVNGRMVEDPEEQRGLVILRECAKAGLGARRALSVLHARRYMGRQSLKCVWSALERLNHGIEQKSR